MKTAAVLGADLSALDLLLEDNHARADALSLQAIENEGDARKVLSDLLGDIARLQAERKIVHRAHAQAVEREADAKEQDNAARRAGHLGEARDAIARLHELAAQVDEMQARFLPLLGDLAETGRTIWQSLRAAGAAPSTAIVGRQDLAGHAMSRLTLAAQGKAIFASDQRTIAAISASAWREFALENDQ